MYLNVTVYQQNHSERPVKMSTPEKIDKVQDMVLIDRIKNK